VGLLLAQLSIAGLPLLASFPIKIAMLTQAAESGSSLGIWSFIGSLGLFLFSIRLLLNMVMPLDDEIERLWPVLEKTSEYLPVLVIGLILVIIGLFPDTFLAWMTDILTAFPQLQ
jgi:NADH:ubiquinone oxidoreductase subunit 2 (subunit N)